VPVPHPLVLEPTGRLQHVDQKEPFNFIALLTSPMMLMVGFSLVMVLVMPSMMNQLELEKQREEREKRGSNPTAARKQTLIDVMTAPDE